MLGAIAAALLLLLAASASADAGLRGRVRYVQFWGDSYTQNLDYAQSLPYTSYDRGNPGETIRNANPGGDPTAGGWDRFVDDVQYHGDDAAGLNCDTTANKINCSYNWTNTKLAAAGIDTDVVFVMWGANDMKLADGNPTPACQWDDTDCKSTGPGPIIYEDAVSIDAVLDAIVASGRACAVGIPPPLYGQIDDLSWQILAERAATLRLILLGEALEHGCGIADFYSLWMQAPEPWRLYNQSTCTSPTVAGTGCVHFEGNATTVALTRTLTQKAIEDAWRIHKLPQVYVLGGGDDAELEAALDRCVALKGCRLKVGAGTWTGVQLDSSKIKWALMPAGFVLEGEGATSILQYPLDGTPTNALLSLAEVTPLPTLIRNLKLDGGGASAVRNVNAPPNGCGAEPAPCPQNLYAAVSLNAGAINLKTYIGLSDLTIDGWPGIGIYAEDVTDLGISQVAVSNIGCDDDGTPDFIPCDASWGTSTHVGNGIVMGPYTHWTAVLNSTIDFVAKYGLSWGTANVDPAVVDGIGESLAFGNTITAARNNTVHSAHDITWLNNTVAQDASRKSDCTGQIGCDGFWVGSHSYNIDIAMSSFAAQGPGLSIRASYTTLPPGDISVRKVSIAGACLQDVGNNGDFNVFIGDEGTDMPPLLLDRIDSTSGVNNYCDRPINIRNATQVTALDFNAHGGDIRFEATAGGSLDGCAVGDNLVDETLPGALTVVNCP